MDGRLPWAGLGLLALAVVVLRSGGPLPSSLPWPLSLSLAGLMVGAASVPLARRTGPALGAVGVGLAAWIYGGRALGPIADVDPPGPIVAAWLLAGVITMLALHLRAPASRLVERVEDSRLG